MRTTLAVDVGGTFTDAVVVSPRGVATGKTPTTPADQSLGVMTAAAQALAAADTPPEAVDSFIHGMTVTTNALLEGTFARTALLATAGFTDVEELGRQNRADLYRLAAARPPAIVPPGLRFAIEERCGPDGVIKPLDEAAARAAIAAAVSAGAESLAVCLLFSFVHPGHEVRLRELADEVAPGLPVSLSHLVVGTFREYERLATTVIDAALAPLLGGYLARLTARASAEGLPEPLVMLSGGGTVPASVAAANASWTVLSGPAGGAVGAARSAERAKATRAIAFDMGGTSTDVSLIEDGRVALAADREIAGRPIALPAVDIGTVGAGGGSIAWRDAGGALRVGPRSAGAMPGPACYGHGGERPTVTDANLLLGRLSEASALAGGLVLDRAAAEAALARLGESLGLDARQTAEGVIEVANLEMLRAISKITVARGIDPAEHELIAFGGAGPMHAAEIAEALEIERVICPGACGVLSAWGMSVSGRRREQSRSVVKLLHEIDRSELAQIEAELAAAACADIDLPIEVAEVQSHYELRYRGQAFELAVDASVPELAAAFAAEHERRFGFADPNGQVELVTVRVSASEPAQPATPPGDLSPDLLPAAPPIATQRIELAEATVVVPEGWSAAAIGPDIVLTRRSAQ